MKYIESPIGPMTEFKAAKKAMVVEKQQPKQSIMGKYAAQFGSRGRKFTEDFGSKAKPKQEESVPNEVTIHVDQLYNDKSRSSRQPARRLYRPS